ncbi:crotonobetaine/carnitine-CoA ligase [Sanguibacter gelidistatuariae]|uniref:Crotonobetaine/carnitine-CoA ligase n=1 Tax=Sanguibacter gelidistatuariae TaxID=1814289 RepID=A0A1G6MZ66_9MICO|nr:crotonobetaine/carnitine-CoA ligase [Sanguibacter gelidistatuariae]SDC60850.1 crotonobetaine/carnitine-CoA ligase [Sanguibacter gelidistatuariae]
MTTRTTVDVTDMATAAGERTLRDLWDDLASTSGDQPFLVFEDTAGSVTSYTYGEFDRLVNRTANLFADLGVAKGTTVAVHLGNCPELLMVMFGLAKIGAVMVPLHPRNTQEECAEMIDRVGARAVVCEPATAPLYGAGPGRIDVAHVLTARAPGEAPKPGALAFEAERDARADRLAVRVPLTGDDPVSIVFTSGTTARSKGVVLTHHNLLFSGVFVDWQSALTAQDRLLTTMPACHVNFQLNALMPVLCAGAVLVAVERFSARSFWRQVCRHEASVVQGIAMMVRTMLLQPAAEWEKENTVREVLYYLPITDAEKEEFEARFDVRLLNSYGTSETLVGVITDPPHGERRWPSIGQVGPGYEARIAGPDGRTLGPGETGEIQVRGTLGVTLMQGYLNDPETTEALFDEDGWMHTGDLGYVDADGWFFFLDRHSQLIKRAGENVSAAEVEAVLAEHPLISEAAVIGVTDPIYDEAVKAFVILADGAALTSREVQDYCCTRLARFKVPTVIEIVDSLPRTASFKIAKCSLR